MARMPDKAERRAVALGTTSVCLAAFALVIWIKMRVVNAPPRSAYAEPSLVVEPAEQRQPLHERFDRPSMAEDLGVKDVGVVPEHPSGIEPPMPH